MTVFRKSTRRQRDRFFINRIRKWQSITKNIAEIWVNKMCSDEVFTLVLARTWSTKREIINRRRYPEWTLRSHLGHGWLEFCCRRRRCLTQKVRADCRCCIPARDDLRSDPSRINFEASKTPVFIYEATTFGVPAVAECATPRPAEARCIRPPIGWPRRRPAPATPAAAAAAASITSQQAGALRAPLQ